MAIAAALAVAFAAYISILVADLKAQAQTFDLSKLEQMESASVILDRNDKIFGQIYVENRETVRFQVQEMLRIERIVRPDKVQEEINVYNELLPGPNEVAATLFLEVTDLAEVQPTLDRFFGGAIEFGFSEEITTSAF